MAVTDEFIEQVSEALDELGYSVEQEHDVIDDVSQLNDDVTLPGIRVDGSGTMTGYVSMKLAVLRTYLSNLWNAWFPGTQSEWNTLKRDAQEATSAANNAASAANTATTYAERVNATMDGMEITVTDRNGNSVTKNIGFDMVGTYATVALMNADAANVAEGKFVIIATDDPTAAENARLYVRNANAATSQNPFSFCADLDQASAAAWADWLNNMKPEIEQAIRTAADDHTRAGQDHQTATSDHTRADTDHQNSTNAAGAANTAAGNADQKATYAKNQGDTAKEFNDHPAYIGDGTTGDLNYWYLYDITQHQYVKGAYAKGEDLDYSTMTQEEIDRLVENIKSDLVFASVETCESIIDEIL